jgi:hypothetical protein
MGRAMGAMQAFYACKSDYEARAAAHTQHTTHTRVRVFPHSTFRFSVRRKGSDPLPFPFLHPFQASLKDLTEGTPAYTAALDGVYERAAAKALEIARANGGVYNKAAQFVASMQGGGGDKVVPPVFIKTLAVLTDRAPYRPLGAPLPLTHTFTQKSASHFFAHSLISCTSLRPLMPLRAEAIDALLVEELGKPSAQLFATFAATPMAAASLAQVHAATLADGTKVAVKVQYPELRANMASDLAVFRTMGAQARDSACACVCGCVGIISLRADGCAYVRLCVC